MDSSPPTVNEIRLLEELTLATSPAIHQWLYGGWVVRASGNDVRRANSATAFYPSTILLPTKISVVEDWYRLHQQAPMFRLNEILTPPELDGLLARQGYAREMDTFMMTLDVGDITLDLEVPAGLRVIERNGDDGLADWHLLKGSIAAMAERDATRQSLWRGSEQYLALKSINGLIACGMARVQNGHVGLFMMRTAEKSRCRGYASMLLAHLLDWGRRHGAHTAFLQVDQANAPANKLYRRFGFAPRYGYWQRVSRAKA